MIAEIVTVGTELLMGQILNSNARWLSQRCMEFGFDMYYQTTVGDNPERMKQVIQTALSRSDIVITTGGLGPTQDDITKDIIAETLNRRMVEDSDAKGKIKQYFCDIHREVTENNYRQALFPEGAILLDNENGTAPGCICEFEGKAVIVLPGPPGELEPMFINHAVPYLQKKINSVLHNEVLHIFGLGEAAVEQMMLDLVKSQSNPTIATYCSAGDVMIRVTAKSDDRESAKKIALPVADELFMRFEKHVYAREDVTLGRAVVDLLIEKRKTLSVAESCTGGMIADMIIKNPGASDVFLEGCIAYSDASKISRLNVSDLTLKTFGAVSEEIAKEMAEGMRITSESDYAISTTGIAGPGGGTADKPVGLVYIALAYEGGVEVKKLMLGSKRDRVRAMASMAALDMLRRRLTL